MGKSIANMYRYAQVSLATNMRYLKYLSVTYDKETPVKMIKEILSSLEYKGRKYSGINILKEEIIHIIEILSNGAFVINGFTNKDIR